MAVSLTGWSRRWISPGETEIHEMLMKDNVMVMRPVEGGLGFRQAARVELKRAAITSCS
ncbi:MAG: hypothetical protein R3D29_03225 [Nitratireductor sp.]